MTLLLFFLQLLYAQTINKKMIFSADLPTEAAAHNLHATEKFFQENMQPQALRRTHKLSVDIDLLV
ncbi:MAG TPA: hypothetical protein ENK98_05725, partial [Epsilonproteobacteria bacterium]|nr:hypothetical protein [Campylobacterota bacterium]